MTRAAVLQLFHEANAFSPLRVSRDEFLARHHMSGEAVRRAFGATRNWMGGVLGALDARTVETRIGLCTAALPGGPVDPASWEKLSQELLGSLDSILVDGRVDYVFLLLHGALLVDGIDDPEGNLATEVRRRIGSNVHLAVPLDFHANPGPALLEMANLVLGGKLYPHTDARDRGARLVELALNCPEVRTRHFSLGLQVPMPRQETTGGAFAELAALTDSLEDSEEVLDVTLLGGFPFSTARHAGTSVLVTATTKPAAVRVRNAMVEAVHSRRDALTTPVPSIAEAMDEVRTRLSLGRVVLVDVGDNPGGGGLGDRTDIIRPLLSLECPFTFGALVAPELVSVAEIAGVGGHVEFAVPGGAERARVERLAEVRYRNVGPMMTGEELFGGPGAVLSIGRGKILVTSLRIQAYDAQAFVSMGVDPERASIIAIKSIGHFRASYARLATGGILLVDSGGYSSPRRGMDEQRSTGPERSGRSLGAMLPMETHSPESNR